MGDTIRPVTILKWVLGKEGKGCIKQAVGTGLFHQWGVDFEEVTSGIGSYSTAIIETDSGEVLNLPVELVKFTDIETNG